VYLNIAGGLRVTDPAIDISVVAAVLSSNVDTAIDKKICMAGEVGMSGEIRPVSRILQRIAEADKLGFEQIIIPRANMNGLDVKRFNLKIHPVGKVEEALRVLFG
jgi:DNA repair protein RadA/Sms